MQLELPRRVAERIARRRQRRAGSGQLSFVTQIGALSDLDFVLQGITAGGAAGFEVSNPSFVRLP